MFRVVWARSPHRTSRNFLLSRPVHATAASADVATRRPAGWPHTSTCLKVAGLWWWSRWLFFGVVLVV